MRLIFLFFVGLGFFSKGSAEPYTLEALIQRAEEFSKDLQIENLRVDEEASRLQGAYRSLFPRIEGQGDFTWQDRGESRSSDTQEFRRRQQTSLRLNARQPLFQGLQELFAIQARQALSESQRARARWTKTQVQARVAELYFDILKHESSLRLLEEQVELTQSRLKDLREWERIGRSRRSERLSAESRVLSLQAELRREAQQLAENRSQLPVVAGLPSTTTLVEPESGFEALRSLESFQEGLRDRMDLQAYELSVKAASKGVSLTWAEHLPTLEAYGNYYLKRTGALEGVDWDVGLQLRLPLFSGGTTLARRNEARAVERRERLVFERAFLEARRELEDLYEEVKNLQEEITLLEKAVEISEENYREQRADYSRGLVTNLDVLESLNHLIESKRRYRHASYDRHLSALRLRLASGEVL